MRIEVVAVVGAVCMTHEDGDALLKAVRAAPQAAIDFEGVKVFSAAFLMAAFGPLMETQEPLSVLMAVRNLPVYAKASLKHVLRNAREYYTVPAVREFIDNGGLDSGSS